MKLAITFFAKFTLLAITNERTRTNKKRCFKRL